MIWFIICGILVGLCLLLYMYYIAHDDKITYEVISHKELPNSFHNFQIFFIADIHRREIKENTLNKINKKIDIVLLGGDLIEKGVPLSRLRKNIVKLKRWGAPIYFVWGNNDYETIPTKIIQLLHEESVTLLEDSIETIQKGNETIHLVGFDYYRDEAPHNIDWEKVKNKYTILLTHTPSSFYLLSEQEKSSFHVVLAGHTHGGQIRIFNLGFYTKGGIKKMDNTTVFVTEGYGYSFLPLRLQTSAECHCITLKTKYHKNL